MCLRRARETRTSCVYTAAVSVPIYMTERAKRRKWKLRGGTLFSAGIGLIASGSAPRFFQFRNEEYFVAAAGNGMFYICVYSSCVLLY